MPKNQKIAALQNVQWITIGEIAEMWAPQLSLRSSLVVRELQLGLYKIEKAKRKGKRVTLDELDEQLAQLPPEEDLPSSDALLNREFIERFCDKELWLLPKFWFQNLPTRRAGRPSKMDPIVPELNRRAAEGTLENTLAAESRALAKWARDTLPVDKVPTEESIANAVGPAFWVLKKEMDQGSDKGARMHGARRMGTA